MGLQIGVEEAALEEIERNYPRDARMAKIKMFGVWLRNCPTPNYLVLVEGLVVIGKRNVAHSLCSARGQLGSLFIAREIAASDDYYGVLGGGEG